MKRIWIAGAALRGPGYPNAQQTVSILEKSGDWQVRDHAHWLPEDLHLWRLASGPAWRMLATVAGLFFANLSSLVSVLLRCRRGDVVYVPYPGLFLMWLVSWIPGRIRPRCIVDAYISIWDSLYRDRGAGSGHGIAGHTLRWAEGRGLRAAWRVIVDTRANREYMTELFGLRPERVHAFPLAIDEEVFAPLAGKQIGGEIEVLFVGTFIPLHGVDVLLEGIGPLLDDLRFRFTFIGDGQSAPVLSRMLEARPKARVEWIRGWCPLDEIAARIAKADICLGIFGGHGKAARVLPFKLYMYMAMGKPVVSQLACSMPDEAPQPPICGADRTEDIRSAMLALAEDEGRRVRMGCVALDYYRQWLGNARVAQLWQRMLDTA